jgi:hypothetical protein
MEETKKMLMKVTFDEETGNYIVELSKGGSVPEMAFAISVVIKCLTRDGYVEKSEDFIAMISNYLNDPQYNEPKLTEEENGN